jgi:hypothetical protein
LTVTRKIKSIAAKCEQHDMWHEEKKERVDIEILKGVIATFD